MIIHHWPGAQVRSQPACASPAICCSCFFSTWDTKGSEDSRRWIENIQETKIGKGRGSWETTARTVQGRAESLLLFLLSFSWEPPCWEMSPPHPYLAVETSRGKLQSLTRSKPCLWGSLCPLYLRSGAIFVRLAFRSHSSFSGTDSWWANSSLSPFALWVACKHSSILEEGGWQMGC